MHLPLLCVVGTVPSDLPLEGTMKLIGGICIPALLLACVMAQSGSPGPSKNPAPSLSPTFARVAVKALLTIEGTRDKDLVDAAMIDLSAAQSTRAELTVVWHMQLFQQIYALDELANNHDEDHRCILAWAPRLRRRSAEIPQQCPRLTREEMKQMVQQ